MNCDGPWKKPNTAGTVCEPVKCGAVEPVVDDSEMAYTKSFHAVKNEMIATVKTPGAASGNTTLRNDCQLVAPSTWAACSISHGICRKNAVSVQIEIGKVSDRYGMIRRSVVLHSPMLRHSLNSGVTMLMTGKTAVSSAVLRTSRLPGKSRRAMPYAANVDSPTPTTVATRQMKTEFTSAGRNNFPPAPVRM